MSTTEEKSRVCIFCFRHGAELEFNREHILPQNIGGILYLDDFVCKECNSTLGSKIDVEILKIPEILEAFDALGILHDKDGITNRFYAITGEGEEFALRDGRQIDGAFTFRAQEVKGGGFITPESEAPVIIEKMVRRDKRLDDAGVDVSQRETLLKQLMEKYDSIKPGEQVNFPSLGIILRKRRDQFTVKIEPKEAAQIDGLVAKIAYEILFFLCGSSLFADSNAEIARSLLDTIDRKKQNETVSVSRQTYMGHEYRPFHFIRVELSEAQTIVKLVLFGCITYELATNPLTTRVLAELKTALEMDEVVTFVYQQEIANSTKSFWKVTAEGKPILLAST